MSGEETSKQAIALKPPKRINPLVEIKAKVKGLVDTLPKLEELTPLKIYPSKSPLML